MVNKKKILIFYFSGHYGGIDTYLTNIIPALLDEYDIVLLSFNDQNVTKNIPDANDHIKYYRLPVQKKDMLCGLLRLWNILRVEKPDLIFSNEVTCSVYCNLVKVFFPKIRHVVAIHCNYRRFGYKPFLIASLYLVNRITRFLVSRYVCVSGYVAASLQKEGIPASIIEVIPNGVSVPETVDKESMSSPARVFYIGRLSKEKGTDTFIEIAKRFSGDIGKIEFHIFGEGFMMGEAENAQNEYKGLIWFHGFVQNPLRSQHADMVVIPSREEGSPFVAVEAFAAGVPVIAANVGGLKEIIDEGYNGLMCRQDDINMYCSWIRVLIGDGSLRDRIIDNALDVAKKKYSIESMRHGYRNLFKNILECSNRIK